MEWLDFLELTQLRDFFRRHKTELSYLPYLLLSKMRDCHLILQDQYESVNRIQEEGEKKEAMYKLLEWFEKETPQNIKRFWKCIFQETLLEQCPTLKRLRDNLKRESHHLETTQRNHLLPSGSEDTMKPVKKKMKTKHVGDVGHDEQPSSSSTQAKKKPTENSFSMTKGDSQTSTNFKSPLSVTCGNLKGKLYKNKFEKGEPCILYNKQSYIPTEFVKVAGRSVKNWKEVIRCQNVTLAKLIKERHLPCWNYSSQQKTNDNMKKEATQAKKEKPKGQLDTRTVFEVTCGDLSGELHKQRFASGSCGMSIRTEKRWMTPDEFVKAASHAANPTWSKDIKWEGKPLSVLVQREILRVHPTGCCCVLCKPSDEDLRKNKNDDKCCSCNSDTGEPLVVCNQCPRAFHWFCHLPSVDDSTLRADWLCTFCVFERIQELHRRYESKKDKTELLQNKTSDYKMQCQYLLLYLFSSDEQHVLPEYKTMLGRRLQKNEIQTIGELESEIKVLFIVSNAQHKGEAETLATCDNLQTMFNRKFAEVFNIL